MSSMIAIISMMIASTVEILITILLTIEDFCSLAGRA